MSTRVTPGTVARDAGFKALQDGSYFKVEPSLHDGSAVGLILHVARSRLPGQFRFSITADGGNTHVYSTGIAGDIERAVTTALIMHEVHEFRKEVGDA